MTKHKEAQTGSWIIARIFFLSFNIFFSQNLYTQATNGVGFYRNPLGIPMDLSANFGELRPNHWHMGLDIRTAKKENIPVYAAADGYIAKIKIEPFGFGRAIYIDHPNGTTTLYGHLNGFFPELEEYVKKKQYELESWAIKLDFEMNQFEVSKGQFIAYSGNTGASHGPHLHFEIRNTETDKCINPLLFGFPVRDDVPPILVRLGLYERSISIYEQTPQLFNLKRSDTGYFIPGIPVIQTGSHKLSFALQAYDRLSGSVNSNGIYAATLIFDEVRLIEFVIDSIDYIETKYINAHIDYRYRKNRGPSLQHLSRMPGDRSPLYKPINADGIITLNDTDVHHVTIEVKDEYQNRSTLNFRIQHSDSLMTPGGIVSSPVIFYPDKVNVIETNDFLFYSTESAMYDSAHVFYYTNNKPVTGAISSEFRIGDASIPLHTEFTIGIRPNISVDPEEKNKTLIRRNQGGRGNVQKAKWQKDMLVADFDEFGNFQAFIDREPPQLNNLGKGDTIDLSPATRILFQPKDNFGIKSFRAELNGRWLRFTNDKGWSYIYNFDEQCPYGVHQLKVTVTDLAGNVTERSWWFKRGPYSPPKKKLLKKKIKKKVQAKAVKKTGSG